MMHSARRRSTTFAPRASRMRSVLLTVVCCGLMLALMLPAGPGALEQTAASPQAAATDGAPIKVLFLGQDKGPSHDPESMFPLLASPLARRGIQLTYVKTPAEALTPEKLRYYDALMIYGNHNSITPEHEKALLEFVEGGKGLVAIHSASAEFTNSEKYLALVGAQFQRHGVGDFTAEIVQPEHPVMQGLKPFSTWDETYVHTKHNPVDRTVLMERVDASGREPWTWVRTQGRGRVFYTAYGHDARTWSKREFAALIENGTSWVVDEAARQARGRMKMPDVVYVDGYNVPNYEQRDPAPKFQVPFSPEVATKFIATPAEFDVQLFASEPDFVKAIAMQFDERGRLWILEARDYPNVVLNGAPGSDQIKILEDTNGDGKADKFTIWASEINIGSGFVFANGGVIVSAPPHMLFLKDTDGDDKADQRQILSTGWGTNDTHAVASSLMYGLDNYVYGTIGYSGFRGQMNGKTMDFSQGAFRFRPDGSDFDYLTRATNNIWGIGINESGDIFGSTANGDPSWYLGIPNRYFENAALLGQGAAADTAGRGRGAGPGYASIAEFTAVHYLTPYIRQVDQMDSYTAGAGHNLYTARSFPKNYWNRIAFVNEPTVHITGQIVLEPSGAGYVGRDGWNLAASADEWFAPVASTVGPDGAVWISDWYNFIIQHNPTPTGYINGKGNAYETSMRDRSRGRIYRVAYKGAAPAPKRSLSRTDTAGLLAALASDNMFWRLTAQRLLVERGQKDVVPQLLALVRNRTMDEIGINGGATHALWTLHGLGELSTTTTESYRAAVEALKHPAAGVRKAAAMVLPKVAASGEALIAANMLADPSMHTRLAVTLAMTELPTSAAVADAVFKASHEPQNFNDTWMARALYLAAAKHKDPFLQAYNNDKAKMPFSALSVPLRMGALTPDWRTPSTTELAADWRQMTLPANWEAQGLPGFDGTVWFARTFDVAPTGALPTTLSLGAVRNQAQVWVNGTPVQPEGGGRGAGGGGGGRGAAALAATPGQVAAPVNPPAGARVQQISYPIPDGVVRRGANTISVRVTNSRAEGGLVGPANQMFVGEGQARTSLAGAWRYRVERPVGNAAVYTRPGELAAHVAFVASGGLTSAAASALPTVRAVPDVTLRLGVVPNEMKYSATELTVQTGQMVEVIFTNNDQMQHNVVVGAPGSLQIIGAAADQLATQPGAISTGYVPDIAQVIVKTPLVDPGQSITFQFRAPAQAGQYPYVCTFPAHWRVMNGILNVVEPQGRGGRGAGRGAPAAPAPGPGAGAGAGPAGRGQ